MKSPAVPQLTPNRRVDGGQLLKRADQLLGRDLAPALASHAELEQFAAALRARTPSPVLVCNPVPAAEDTADLPWVRQLLVDLLAEAGLEVERRRRRVCEWVRAAFQRGDRLAGEGPARIREILSNRSLARRNIGIGLHSGAARFGVTNLIHAGRGLEIAIRSFRGWFGEPRASQPEDLVIQAALELNWGQTPRDLVRTWQVVPETLGTMRAGFWLGFLNRSLLVTPRGVLEQLIATPVSLDREAAPTRIEGNDAPKDEVRHRVLQLDQFNELICPVCGCNNGEDGECAHLVFQSGERGDLPTEVLLSESFGDGIMDDLARLDAADVPEDGCEFLLQYEDRLPSLAALIHGEYDGGGPGGSGFTENVYQCEGGRLVEELNAVVGSLLAAASRSGSNPSVSSAGKPAARAPSAEAQERGADRRAEGA